MRFVDEFRDAALAQAVGAQITALTEPRMPWLPWLTLPECPIVSSGPMPTPAKNSTARMTNTTPTTASAITSGRFEPAPPEPDSELTRISFEGCSLPSFAVQGAGILRWPAGRAARQGS